jgi:alkanesulfonate monooxygenase SsuD/methylene tetrahydromethanopterin reductase-like flavin-dependent oxidoreductase (luciferase family)
VYVGESEEVVRRDTEQAISWVWRSLEWMGALSQGHAGRLDEWLREGPPPAMSYEHFYEKRGFFGTPDRVRRQLRALRDNYGVTYFGANSAFGGRPHGVVLRSIRLLRRRGGRCRQSRRATTGTVLHSPGSGYTRLRV